jgi:hypothetical protein
MAVCADDCVGGLVVVAPGALRLSEKLMRASGKRIILSFVCGVLLLLAILGALRIWQVSDVDSASPSQVQLQRAALLASEAEAKTRQRLAALQPTSGARGDQVDTPTAAEMARIFGLRDFRAALAIAGASNDPAVWGQMRRWLQICNAVQFEDSEAKDAQLTANFTVEQRENMRRSANEIRSLPPLRIAPPVAQRQAAADFWRDIERAFKEKITPTPAPSSAEAVARDAIAFVSEEETRVRQQMIEHTRASCKGFSRSEAMRLNIEAFKKSVRAGALGAQIQRRQSRWDTPDFGAIPEDDYPLFERAFAERQPDALVVILAGSATASLDLLQVDPLLLESSSALRYSGSKWVAELALCSLNVTHCGPESHVFRIACVDIGGCLQPDLGSLIRFALARDGVDPMLIDDSVARVLAAIYARDLAALGIRKKQ